MIDLQPPRHKSSLVHSLGFEPGADVPLNKVRFLLTPDEAAKVDALTKEIEQRLGYLLAADYIAPEPVLADEEASAQTA